MLSGVNRSPKEGAVRAGQNHLYLTCYESAIFPYISHKKNYQAIVFRCELSQNCQKEGNNPRFLWGLSFLFIEREKNDDK
jgi:hypothetical protein